MMLLVLALLSSPDSDWKARSEKAIRNLAKSTDICSTLLEHAYYKPERFEAGTAVGYTVRIIDTSTAQDFSLGFIYNSGAVLPSLLALPVGWRVALHGPTREHLQVSAKNPKCTFRFSLVDPLNAVVVEP